MSKSMSIISDADPESSPTVLIVDNNEMAMMRMREIFRQREFHVIECTDGDKAVDEYIRNDPELVVMSLDIPTLDGHLAALEMREHGGDCRILFAAPRRQRKLAIDATHSAGAVGWVEKPVTNSMLDEIWDTVLGDIPEAPGLEDIDQLYPEEVLNVEVEEEELDLNFPLPMPVPTEEIVVSTTQTPQKKKSKKFPKLLLLLCIVGLAAGAYIYFLA